MIIKHIITLEQAIKMISLFRKEKATIFKSVIYSVDVLPDYGTYEQESFDAVLAQPRCVRLRVYFGMEDNLQIKTIIVRVNEKGEDILPLSTEIPAIIEESALCPPFCAPESPLNSYNLS